MRIRLIAMVSLCYLLSSSLFCVGRSFQCSSFSTNSIGRTAAMVRSRSSHITLDRRKLTSLEASKPKSSHFSTLMDVQPVTPAKAMEATTIDAMAPFHVDCLAKTSDELSFVVYGEPMSLQRHRVLRSGITYNPSSKLQKQFLDSCSSILPDSPLEGPLEARMVFYFKRPLNHYGTGKNKAILKPGMDIWHSKRKDIDNIAKFVLDAINKKAYEDDGQVAVLSLAKLYTDTHPRVEVRIRKLADNDIMFAENFDSKLV